MKNSSSKRALSASFKLKPTMVIAGQATVGAFWALAATGSVYAQAAPAPSAPASATAAAAAPADTAPGAQAPAVGGKAPQGVQQVTVTGIRRGIEAAISVKKNSDQIVEAISAEDIGKLPDTTIAESLARLPGVTTQRDSNGNATNVTIRGLGPDFNGYLLNGREQTSTGDSRAVDLSVYPAELIAGATVYKTGDAGLMTAGLAGTIDNRLVEPLAFSGRQVSITGEKTETGRGLPEPGHGKRYSLTYIDQFADRKIGIAMGFVHADGKSTQIGAGQWGDGTHSGTLADGTAFTNVEIPTFGNGISMTSTKLTDNRNGLAGVLQLKPNKDFNSEFDFYHAFINDYKKNASVKASLGGLAVTNATITNNQISAGTFQLGGNPNGLIIDSEGISDHDTLKSYGWKNSLNLTDTWRASLDLNHNSAQRVERDVEYYGGIPTADTLSFTTPNGFGMPKLSVGNPTAYTDAQTIVLRDQTGWAGTSPASAQDGYLKGPTTVDKLDAARLDFSHDLAPGGIFSTLEFGGNITKRTKDRFTDEGLVVSATNGGFDPIAYPSNSYVQNDIGETGISALTFDPMYQLIPGATIQRKFNNDILSKTWNVAETASTAYGKLDIDSELAHIPVRGNVGLQVVHTLQQSSGYRADIGSSPILTNPAAAESTTGTSYNDVLPSLNLVGDLGNGNLLRFGAGIQIARPDMTDMRNSFSVSVDQTTGLLSGAAGNPDLKPFKAKALDLSYEKYFANKGYLSGAVFYKHLDTYISQTNIVHYDFTQAANAVGLTGLPSYIGTFTTPSNQSGGNLKGIELSASAPFNLLTHWLEGFGAIASYSNTTSSVRSPNTLGLKPTDPTLPGTIGLEGLSHLNEKLELYYERAGFSAFIAENYRSPYVGRVANSDVGGYPTLINVDAQKWVSAQVGYEVQDGPLKGLGLRLEGNNLNKPVYREFNYDGSVHSENHTGASVDLRVSYKL